VSIVCGKAVTIHARRGTGMTRIQSIKRVLYVVPVVGAVVFGTAQAFASPAPREELACTTDKQCSLSCGAPGGICRSGICLCK
jgi:hypothetical protein